MEHAKPVNELTDVIIVIGIDITDPNPFGFLGLIANAMTIVSCDFFEPFEFCFSWIGDSEKMFHELRFW